MNLSTSYLGLKLKTPLVPSASPLSLNLDNIKRMEDAGAAAIVLHSLFEEQFQSEQYEFNHSLALGDENAPPETRTNFPKRDSFRMGPDDYLQQITKAKRSVDIPIIASLNGSTLGGWTSFSKLLQEAGADALELNIYNVVTDAKRFSVDVEESYLEIIKAVKSTVTIPVSVKLSPFFTNFARMAERVNDSGADGLVLFNRFYQPDIELESISFCPNLLLSTPMSMRLPLRWIGILYGRVACSLAGTSGVHRGTDAIKLVLAGADIAMLCSVLLQRGISHIAIIEKELRDWMEKHEFDSIEKFQGSMSQRECQDSTAFERAQYMKTLVTSHSHSHMQ